MLYNVYIHSKDAILPEDETYYLVASNGIWLCNFEGICKSVTKVDSIPFLDQFQPQIEFEVSLPPLPESLVYKTRKFFEKVCEAYRSEAVVVLYYSPASQTFLIDVPEQRVSHASVHYETQAVGHVNDEYLKIGTIHSHADFGAFHSSTDVDDEVNFDGLHVTFGNNDKEVFTISASHCVGSKRKIVHPMEVMNGLIEINGKFSLENKSIPEFDNEIESWMEKVKPY